MGYRTYISYISLKQHNKIKDMNREQLFKQYRKKPDDYFAAYDIAKNELHNFGKYTQFDTKHLKPVFSNKELQKEFNEEHDFYVAESEFLKGVIEHYADKVKTFYADMANPFYNNNKRRTPKEFLSSVKKNYESYASETYKFDFSKITNREQTALFKIFEHIRESGNEWGLDSLFSDMRPYNIGDGKSIVSSWKYEYSIFELVHIYKTFDWQKNVMIYYGY